MRLETPGTESGDGGDHPARPLLHRQDSEAPRGKGTFEASRSNRLGPHPQVLGSQSGVISTLQVASVNVSLLVESNRKPFRKIFNKKVKKIMMIVLT